MEDYSLPVAAPVEHCWSRIGITGDRTCPELKEAIHCRNCPVYSTAARTLLDRAIPDAYGHEWTTLAASAAETRLIGALPVVVFRVQSEWLALPVRSFKEITPPAVIHSLPHRRDPILRGLVSVRGEILMCVSMDRLLDLAAAPVPSTSPRRAYSRMAVVERDADRWVFSVDEVKGIHRLHPDDSANVPVTVIKSPQVFVKALFGCNGETAAFLDEDALFGEVHRKLLS